MAKKWYIIHTQTGYEDKVKANIEKRAETSGMKDLITEVLVPIEKVSEVKDGKKKISTRKFFPGYVLVHLDLTDKIWYLIKNTPGVSGFIGSGRKPVPLPDNEVESILKQTELAKEKPTPKVIFEDRSRILTAL